MKKTLLLCFIHGFKGDDNTFANFPEHLRALVNHGLPKVNVVAIVYPKFETRGDLAECVSRFRDWLQEKVIDIEVANSTPSPTVDPSVHTILIGHSMGGIVAADTLLALASDPAIDSSSSFTAQGGSRVNALMFPYVQGVLAFDTPYLGISPGVVAHGAEGHYNTASEALATLSGLTGGFWGGKVAAEASSSAKDTKKGKGEEQQTGELASSSSAGAGAGGAAPPLPAWQRWGKVAAIAGAGAAVAAGGGLAYLKRDQITSSWSWVGSHLEFVGCLMRAEDLKRRVASVLLLNRELGVGFANLHTRLGKAAVGGGGGGGGGKETMVGSVLGNQRTFCQLPATREGGGYWREAVNDLATDEILAHINMFKPKDNTGYYSLSEDAKALIVDWVLKGDAGEWYESSTGTGEEAAFMNWK